MDSKGVPFFLLLLVSFHAHIFSSTEARPFPVLINKDRYVKVLQTLGMTCRCCDGAAGHCRSSWDSPCAKPVCRPWKFL